MPIFNNILAGASGQATGYDIDQSLRFEDGDSAKLTRTPGSAGSLKTWTISAWVKRGNLSDGVVISAGTYSEIKFSSDILQVQVGPTNSTACAIQTSAVYRDPSAWYHIVVHADTTQASASNRLKLYVNGEEVTALALDQRSSISQDVALTFTGAYEHRLGVDESSAYFDGYIAEVNLIDGQALTPASFGETNEDTNQWQAIKYAGSYGTNGFYLKFQDSSALGDDSSGNTNDFSATNLVATDQVLDSPTNNFATLNPLWNKAGGYSFTLSEGNLKNTVGTGGQTIPSTFIAAPLDKKWYWEWYGISGGANKGIGVILNLEAATSYENQSAYQWKWEGTNGIMYNTGGSGSYTLANSTLLETGDVGAIFIDGADIKFYKNGSLTYTATNAITAANSNCIIPSSGGYHDNNVYAMNFGQDSSFAGEKTSGSANASDANGIGDFYHTPPTGALACCTDNLPDPSIADPTVHYNATTWSGDDSASRAITTGVDADFVWYKQRNGTEAHSLYDSIRGAQKRLISNYNGSGADVERTRSTGLQSFDSTGFTVGSDTECNGSGRDYIGWTWKAGGASSSNTDGSITSSVSANATAGFSIVSFDGNGTSGATVGHGLSQAPELIIVKGRNLSGSSASAGWVVYSKPLGNTKYLYLNETDQEATDSGRWNDTTPTASVFTLGDDGVVNTSSSPYIAYCFHGVDGFSKVGSYTANGNNNGPFIYTGFQPAFFLVKKYASVGGDNWAIYDNKRNETNVMNTQIYPDSSSAEESSSARNIDFLSNGVKIRGTNSRTNDTSGYKFVYLTFSGFPFKTSNAR